MPLENLMLLLGASDAFSALPAKARQRVASLLQEEAFAVGDVIAREGDPGDALFLIVEGSVGLSRPGDGITATAQLGIAEPGTIIGELGLLTGHPRAATMISEEASVVASLSRANFDLLCLEFPQQMEIVVACMQQQLHTYQIR
jgi:voltage-gated potassium channel